jgi:hypothetical protein
MINSRANALTPTSTFHLEAKAEYAKLQLELPTSYGLRVSPARANA